MLWCGSPSPAYRAVGSQQAESVRAGYPGVRHPLNAVVDQTGLGDEAP
jgi:hypothetical protein